jgi:hypothetical protein
MSNKEKGDKSKSSDNADSHKMKFLDNLFDSKTEYNMNESTMDSFDRTYIKLSDSINTECPAASGNNTDKRLMRKMSKIFGLKTWVGMFFSFFFLCYVFSFKIIIVVPLLFIALIIYAVMTLGHKYFNHYMKISKSYLKSKFRKMKVKNDQVETSGEYTLMEI